MKNLKILKLLLSIWINKQSGLWYNSLWHLFQPKHTFYCAPSEDGQFLPL